MSECVLCLGNGRKQTFFKVEILISELQSKLWKRHLRALHRGPHPSEESGTPPENTPFTRSPCSPHPPTQPRVDGSSSFRLEVDTVLEHVFGVAQLMQAPAAFVVTNKTVQSLCVRCSWDCAAYCYPKARFPPKFVMLLVSGTFFFLPQR